MKLGKFFIDKNGYPRWRDSGKLVHLTVARKKFGQLPPGKIVHHKDGNKLNFRFDNLELMTRKQHAKHHFRIWRFKRDVKIALIAGIVFFILLFILLSK